MNGAGPSADPEPDRGLVAVLERSRELGFLGPGPLEPHIEHARGFASMVERTPDSFLDLGSGGGVPGLVLALLWPGCRGVLLDAAARRTDFLREACEQLALAARIEVVCERAEVAGRHPALREGFDLVTARAFAQPAVTAECGVAFLRPGGRIVVSEPPADAADRWPTDGLGRLALEVEAPATPASRYVVLRRVGPLDERWPRRTGIPGKRPLWR
jgi:16S rRNA (guanine527-N7)-methyltransferase